MPHYRRPKILGSGDAADMSAKDLFHEAVKHALQKDQWRISSDPPELEWEEVKINIDLAAERKTSF